MLLPPFYEGLPIVDLLNPQTARKILPAATPEMRKRLLTLPLAQRRRNTKAFFENC